MNTKRLPDISLSEFLDEFADNRRIVEYVKTMMQWTEIAVKFNKTFLIQGGFAVELANGKITRDHDDLDALVLSNDANWFKERFPLDGNKLQFTEGKDPETHFCAYKYNFMTEGCLYIDLGSIHIDGNEVWDDEDGKKYVWPIQPEALIWERSIERQTIQFLNPQIVHEFKRVQREKDVKRPKEEHDFEVLKPHLPPKKASLSRP